MAAKLVKRDGGLGRPKPKWPNLFIFPKEMRDAIPDYGSRALVFDEVSGAPGPASVFKESPAAAAFDFGPRGRVQSTVHETGKFEGKYALNLDLDAETMRSLGRFLIDLADRAKSGEN